MSAQENKDHKNKDPENNGQQSKGIVHKIEHRIEISAILTLIGIIFLFSGAVVVTLLAPRYVDPSWTTPSTPYQVQMYEVADPNVYISSATSGQSTLQFIYHIKEGYTLLGFHETATVKIVAPKELEKYITRFGEDDLKLTSHLLLLRKPKISSAFDATQVAAELISKLQKEWESDHPNWREEKLSKPSFEVLELYQPEGKEAFAVAPSEGQLENWIDARQYVILDEKTAQPYHKDPGVIYVNNPLEYRVQHFVYNNQEGWRYDPKGDLIQNYDELKSHPLGFVSRKELIALGEHIYAIEGCWYCHTDQTRTLVQDVVLNGSDTYPAPPSSANEYIYQQITFPGTRRIGPDVSRTGIKRPSRDWHKGHFWSPKTASKGSIMPAFRHFFDDDPRGQSRHVMGVPNYRFEAIYQYLMTKGTRITPPTQGWWIGKDPVNTKKIIEGRDKIP